ncbi:hypothetical protein BDR07DRAFT_1382408 [Suillus spraguei]|nr:hypothetical protein BDR07DRAFT_1382408 [Suillus spraguei]
MTDQYLIGRNASHQKIQLKKPAHLLKRQHLVKKVRTNLVRKFIGIWEIQLRTVCTTYVRTFVLKFALHSLHSLNTGGPQIQAVLSGVEIEFDTQSALQDAQEPAKRMHPRPGPAITVVAVDRDAQTDLHNAVKFQYTSLKPLRIFDEVIGKIVDVCKPLLDRN